MELYSKSEDQKTNLSGQAVTYVPPKWDKLLRKVRDKNLVDKSVNATNKKKINAWLQDLDIPMYVSNIVCGNAVVRFEISLLEEESGIGDNAQVKLISEFEQKRKQLEFVKILQEHKNKIAIALGLGVNKVMIDAGEYSDRSIVIELPNTKNKEVCLLEVLLDEKFQKIKNNHELTESNCSLAIGKTVEGENLVLNLKNDPNLLISGNRQDKDNFINSMMMSLMFSSDPNHVKIILIDLDDNNLSKFEGIPHLCGNGVCTDIEEAEKILLWLVQEMEDRYALFSIARSRNIEQYNAYAKAENCMIMQRIVVVIPEIAPFIEQEKRSFEKHLVMIAQKVRTIGIHVVIGSSKSTRDIFTGTIKTLYGSRITFKQNSKEESKIAFGVYGGENLLGDGDMLIYQLDADDYERAQGCKVTQEEIEKVMQDVLKRNSTFENVRKCGELRNESDESFVGDDPRLKDAIRYAIIRKSINHGILIRDWNLSIYRARKLLDTMIEKGYVASEVVNGHREIYIDIAQFEKEFGEDLYLQGDKH